MTFFAVWVVLCPLAFFCVSSCLARGLCVVTPYTFFGSRKRLDCVYNFDDVYNFGKSSIYPPVVSVTVTASRQMQAL